MTISKGSMTLVSPCCGRHYSFPRYTSINFSAFEYWTDGWRELSLMPNDEGLRRCHCGEFILLKSMTNADEAKGLNLPSLEHVSGDLLPECIAQTVDKEIEIAARLGYWRHLNHNYRERYRRHRDTEEAATQAKWKSSHPDTRSWWDKLRGRKPPAYIRPADSPFTCPPFEPTKEQVENMERLSSILLEWTTAFRGKYTLELAELYREQARFGEAESVILSIDDAEVGMASQLITRLITEKETAPMRYRM